MATGSGPATSAIGKGRRRLPLFESFRGYRAGFIPADLLAGLTLAAIAIPEQMATARLGSLPPQAGFFAFIAATLAFALFGSSGRLSAGADSTITPIFAGGLALAAASAAPHYAALAALLALMVGIVVAAAGLMRMGWIGDLLSTPVTLGFLAGIAVHIAVSQLPAALGLPALHGPTLARIASLAQLAPQTNPAAAGLAVLVLAAIAASHRLSARIPGALIAVVLAALAASMLHLKVALLGPVPGGLPQPALPSVSLKDIVGLAPLALIVALVVMVQTAATARAFPPEGGTADENRDFIGLGLANLAAGLAGAFPVNASPPRTAITNECGGRSQLAGLAAVAVVAAIVLAGTALLEKIPEAALSGILLFVAARIVRLRQMADVARTSPVESVLILVTAAAIVVLPIETGVGIGIALSLLHGLWSSARMRVRPLSLVPGTSIWWPTSESRAGETAPGVAVLGFQAPITFMNAEFFQQGMLAAIRPGESDVRLAVLEGSGIIDIDYTAAQAIKSVLAACREAGIVFAIARLESVTAQSALKRLGLVEAIGADHVFDSVADALAALGPGRPSAP